MIKAVYKLVAIGSSKGKTRIGTQLVEELVKLGVRVGVVKHTIHEIDVAGKDSYKYTKSGATPVIVSSPKQLAVFYTGYPEDLDKILEIIPQTPFVVIAEGFKQSRRGKKIIIASSQAELEELLKIPGENFAIVDMGSNSICNTLDESKLTGMKCYSSNQVNLLAEAIYNDAVDQALTSLPGVNCGYCGYSTCRGLAKDIVRGIKKFVDCPVASEVKVVLNRDTMVSLNPYVKRVFTEVIRGLLNTLKGIPSDVQGIYISIDLKEKEQR